MNYVPPPATPDTPSGRIRVDGTATDAVPADDRGLAYGDGVFRTLVVEAGQPVAWTAQYERLVADCERLALIRPREDDLLADLDAVFPDASSGVGRITVTRTGSGRGYGPPSDAGSRRIVVGSPLPGRPANRVLGLDVSDIELGLQPAFAGVKHLARLEQVVARAACQRAEAADAAMCDSGGRLICTTMRNLMFVDADGHWATPSLTRAGVAGATRARVMAALAGAGESIIEADLGLADLDRYVGAIATNSVTGVSAVTRIGDSVFDQSGALAECADELLVQSSHD